MTEKTERRAVTYSISERQIGNRTEYRVMHGNKIVGRFVTAGLARAEFDRLTGRTPGERTAFIENAEERAEKNGTDPIDERAADQDQAERAAS